jgi:hypothetical protein
MVCITLISLLCGIAASGQWVGEGRDHENYLIYFDLIATVDAGDVFEYRFEPVFAALALLLSGVGFGSSATYGAIVAFVMWLKLWRVGGVERGALAVVVFLAYYLVRYFPLFELTVLRACLALTLAFLVFYRINPSSGYKWSDLALLVAASFAHYSAFVFLIVYFCAPLSRWKASLVLVGSAVAANLIVGSALQPLAFVFPVLDSYDSFSASTTFPVILLMDLALVLVCFLYWGRLRVETRVAAFGLLLGLAMHFALLEYAQIGGRVRELLSIFACVIVVAELSRGRSGHAVWVAVVATFAAILSGYLMFVHDPLFA